MTLNQQLQHLYLMLMRVKKSKYRYELTLVCATNSAGADVFASLDWEEVSR